MSETKQIEGSARSGAAGNREGQRKSERPRKGDGSARREEPRKIGSSGRRAAGGEPKKNDVRRKSGATGKSVGAVVHALRILRCLAAAPGELGVANVARQAKVSPSTTFNILRTLVGERILTFNEVTKAYRVAPGILDLAAGTLGLGEVELIRPSIDNLALNIDIVVGVWRLTDDERMVLIDRAYGDVPVRVELSLGHRLPYWSGAVGRALAASLELDRSELRNVYLKVRWSTPPSFETYLEEIGDARQRGYAVDNNEFYRGVTSIAAIIRDARGKPSFGLTGSAFTGQLDEAGLERAGKLIRAAAEEIGASLVRLPGYAHPHPKAV